MRILQSLLIVLLAACIPAAAKEKKHKDDKPKDPIKEGWDYAPAMKEVAKKFKGVEGTVVHFGDNNTMNDNYADYAQDGKDLSAEEETLVKWMHADKKKEEANGWYLATHSKKKRSETAAEEIRLDQFIQGGHEGMPSLDQMLHKFRPQMAVILLGSYDADAGRNVERVTADMRSLVDKCMAAGCIPILSTLPPHKTKWETVKEYNGAYKRIAEEKQIPLIDLAGEMDARQGNSALKEYLQKDGIELSKDDAKGPATEKNLSKGGFLLRGWLSVQKIKEVKAKVVDAK